ncbi:MAG TPA: hypothetical protein VJP45_02535 [Candidatus Limnocylindria bacterium]|nr:hypothetical protein [Candidatus Limnocylindria bacterium]
MRLVFSGKGPAVPPPPPQPRELIDVLGVGTTQTVGGVALTLLSIERYQEGLIALFRMFRARGLLEREFPSPHLELAVMPVASVPYRIWMTSGGGGGGMREIEYRHSYAIVPAPPDDANELVIEATKITWERYRGTGSYPYEVVKVDVGPWRFRVAG